MAVIFRTQRAASNPFSASKHHCKTKLTQITKLLKPLTTPTSNQPTWPSHQASPAPSSPFPSSPSPAPSSAPPAGSPSTSRRRPAPAMLLRLRRQRRSFAFVLYAVMLMLDMLQLFFLPVFLFLPPL